MSDLSFPQLGTKGSEPEPCALFKFQPLTPSGQSGCKRSLLTSVKQCGSLPSSASPSENASEDKENTSSGNRASAGASRASAVDAVIATPSLVKPIRVIQPGTSVDELPSIIDLVFWKSPIASFVALAGGLAVCAFAHWFFSKPVPFLSGSVSLLACMLGLNFIRSVFSATWLRSSMWRGSEFEAFLIRRSKDFITFTMLARDEVLCSQNPWTMLRTCLVLTALHYLAFHVSFWAVAGFSWTTAFVFPVLQKHAGRQVMQALRSAAALTSRTIGKLKLDRTSKLLWIAAAAGLLMVFADSTTRMLLVLAFLMFGRCHLNHAELEALQTNSIVRSVAHSPYLRTAYRTSTRVGGFADDVLMSAMKSARKQFGWPDELGQH